MSEKTTNLRSAPAGEVIRIACGGGVGITAALETPRLLEENYRRQMKDGEAVHVDVGRFRYFVQAWREELCGTCCDVKSGCMCDVLVPA